MADFPLGDGGVYATVGVGSSTSGVRVTAGSAGAKGSWVELASSTPFPASGLMVHVMQVNTAYQAALDIGIGPSGSEVVLIPDIAFAAPRVDEGVPGVQFAVEIPAGTRLAARFAASSNSVLAYVMVTLLARGFSSAPPPTRCTTYGVSGPNATVVDPGATADTKGSWVQITAATAHRIRLLTVMVTDLANTARSSARWFIDVGVGASGSEVIVIPNLPAVVTQPTDRIGPQHYSLLPVDIPEGSRLAVRAQCSITDANDRLIGVALVGMD